MTTVSYTYTPLDPFFYTTSFSPRGINNAGQIVGIFSNDDGNHYHGFLYSGGTYTSINDPSSVLGNTFGLGINNNGLAVGYSVDINGQISGFLYGGGTYTPLAPLDTAGYTIPLAINDTGEVGRLCT